MSDQTTAPGFEDDVQSHIPLRWGAQSEQPEGDDDTEGHRASADAEQAEGDDDTEGHRSM